jgi:2'-5' RNA ligase
MRSFVAVEVDEPIRMRLAELRDKGIMSGGAVRWVRPELMHITLKFLGEIDPATVPDVTQAIQNASEGMRPFEIEFKTLGFFPDARRPRVFWAGIEDKDKNLEILYRRLETELLRLKFEGDRKGFHPHLTLARIKDRIRGGVQIGEEESAVFGSQTVGEVTLFKSELRPQGPRYTPLATVTLPKSC